MRPADISEKNRKRYVAWLTKENLPLPDELHGKEKEVFHQDKEVFR